MVCRQCGTQGARRSSLNGWTVERRLCGDGKRQCRLSVAVRPAVFAGMRAGGRREAAVDAGMIIGVEPSGALRTVLGTIAETPALRQCRRGYAQQQRHCHDKFVALMVGPPRCRTVTGSPCACYRGSDWPATNLEKARCNNISHSCARSRAMSEFQHSRISRKSRIATSTAVTKSISSSAPSSVR